MNSSNVFELWLCRLGSNEYIPQSAVPMEYETHSAEDVGIFARGPMSHLFHGVHEQHYVAHVIQYAACIGDYRDSCDREDRGTSGSASPSLLFLGLVVLGVFTRIL